MALVNWLVLVGGVSALISGLHMMSSGLKLTAASKLKKYLNILTNNPLLGALTGAVVTMILQSSSITTIMVVGLVNTGLINFTQGISIIIGANIGTTITAQILAFQLTDWALPITAVGLVFLLLGRFRSPYLWGLGKSLLGAGLLFLGLYMMTTALKPLRESPYILNLLLEAGEVPLQGVLIGALSTFLFQSSGAVIGIIMAMAVQGMVSLPVSIAIILGADMGTCITSMIASIGTDIHARRTAFAHLIFNIIGATCLLTIFNYFTSIVMETSPVITRQIANAHTLYNIFNALIILPFVNIFARFIEYIIPEKKSKAM